VVCVCVCGVCVCGVCVCMCVCRTLRLAVLDRVRRHVADGLLQMATVP